jgi:hypothetical protein
LTKAHLNADKTVTHFWPIFNKLLIKM